MADASAIAQARAAGYSDEEINSYLAPKMAAAQEAGYSQDEINAHLGIQTPPPLDGTALRAHGTASLAAAPKPVTSFTDALEAGWQLSTAGLITRGAAPTKAVADNAPMYSRIAGQVAETVGDLPAMSVGGVLGAATAPNKYAGAVLGTAGAFALPAALRATLMDAYQHGQAQTFSDFWPHASGIMIDTAKGWLTGAATGGAGVAVGAAMPLAAQAAPWLASPAVKATTETAAQIATMTTVGAALEGHAPNAQDFLDAAILLGGLKFAEVGAGRLRSIYAKTGIPPSAVIQDAATDVSVQQDLLSDRAIPGLYDGPESGVSVGGEPGTETTTEGRATPYETLPPEPERLINFLRGGIKINEGMPSERVGQFGLQDPGGDIAAIVGGPKGRPGLINNATGERLDDAGLRAHEAGYFPQGRPDINQVLDAISEDHNGNPVYSSKDQDAAEAFRYAVASNSEIARLASQTGISERGLTRDQFFDAVTDQMSQDQAIDHMARLEDEHSDAYAALEQAAKDAGTPLAEHVRSLEDLENEYRQEIAASTASQRDGSGEQSGPAGRSAGAGQDGGGQVGGAAGASGRDGSQAGANGSGGGPGGATGNVANAGQSGGGVGSPPAVGGAPAGAGGPPGTTPPGGVQGPSGSTPEQRILAHISIGQPATTRPWTWARLYTDVVNKIFPIEQAVTRTAGRNALPVAEDPGKLARLMSGATGIADRFLRYDTLDFNTRQPNGVGLETILGPLKDDLDGFRAFIASRHAIDLESQGIKTGFDLTDAASVVATGARFQPAADELTAFSNRLAAYLRDSGVISPTAYNEMVATRAFYVPFQRVFDSLGGQTGPGDSLQASNPVKGMTGSERMVIDPLESIIRNAYLFTQMAERNVVGTKLVDLLLPHGEAENTNTPPPPGAPLATLRALGVGIDPHEFEAMVQAVRPVGGAEVRIFRDGTPETYRVDPELAMAVKNLDSQSMGDMERMLRPFANALRAGAVLQPDFVARHSIRDFLYAVVTHPGFFSPLDMIRGFTSLAVKDADYQEWLSSGGASVSMVSLDRRYLQNSINDLTGTGILERAWNVVDNPGSSVLDKTKAVAGVPLDAARKFILSPMQAAVHFAESATHIGTFIKAKNEALAGQPPSTQLTKEQILDAGFASRDIAVDAARMGAKMRTWNALSAFSNIAIQDSDRVVRAFINAPMSTAVKVAGAISLPSALAWMNGQGDSRYEDAPDWQKDLFWVIPTDRWQVGADDGRPRDQVRTVDGQTQINNGITFRIPKPWGMGLIFGSGVERGLSAFAADKPDAFKGFGGSMAAVSIPSLIPNAVTPIIEQFANRSTFTNRTLVPDQMEKYLPEYQYTPYTTETSKALGQIMGAFPGIKQEKAEPGMMGGVARALSSPILMENYLRAWTGNLGMYALQAADKGLRVAGALPDPPRPDDTLADIPFVKAFVARYPSASTQSIQDFSDAFTHNKTYFDTWQAMAKEGNLDAMQRIQAAGGPMMMIQLTGIHTALAEHSRIVRDIFKNPDIPSDEKRQLIDTTYWRMTELAKVGNQALAAAKASMKEPAQ